MKYTLIVLGLMTNLLLASGEATSQSAPAPSSLPSEASSKVKTLIADLASADLPVRVAAADALSRMGQEAQPAIPAMLLAMDGQGAWSDFAMMDALAGLGPVSLPALCDVFANGPKELRPRAGRALWTMGAAAKEAIPLLEKVAKDPDEKVRTLAGKILEKIHSELAESGQAASQPAAAVAAASQPAVVTDAVGDWPCFHGPNRDSICPETGLLKTWNINAPKLAWNLKGLGKGLSTISIAGGKFFTMGERKADGREVQFVQAYDLKTRKELWAVPIGEKSEYGPLGTPTIDGERAYAIGTDGLLLCLNVNTGTILWQKDLKKEFGGQMMNIWKYSESPLVDGEKLICTPGGKEAAMVAMDKTTGRTIWATPQPDIGKLGKDGAGYSSPVVAVIDGVRQYINITGCGAVSFAADTGTFLWGYNKLACDIANITHPVVRGNFVFVTNSYNTGSALLEIKKTDKGFVAKEVYFLTRKEFENHHGGVVLVGDCIYGGSGLNRGEPTCIEFATGRILWKAKAPSNGSAAVLYADGHILLRYDRGLMVLVEANPKKYREEGRFMPLTVSGPAWAHPVIHDRKLYLRHNDLLACYDLAAP